MSSLYAKENVLINSKGFKVELVYLIKKLIRLISQVSCKRRKSSNNPPCSRCIVRIRDDHDHDEHVQVCPLSTCRYYCVCVCVYVCCFCVCVRHCGGGRVCARHLVLWGGWRTLPRGGGECRMRYTCYSISLLTLVLAVAQTTTSNRLPSRKSSQ